MAERKNRIGSRLRVAITAMVEEALTRQEAARKAGITDHALYCALRKPHVCQFRAEVMEVLRTSESAKTFARVAKLADGAESEHVRLNAAIHLGEIDGISAVAKAEITHTHQIPGLVIVRGGQQAVHGNPLPVSHVIDARPRPAVKMIGRATRHAADPRADDPDQDPDPLFRGARRGQQQHDEVMAASSASAPPQRVFPTPIRGKNCEDDDEA